MLYFDVQLMYNKYKWRNKEIYMSTEVKTPAGAIKQKRYVGVKETVLYGVANGGQCIGYNMIRSQLNLFLIIICKVPAEAVALMSFIMGIWDAFNDPLMGSIVDRTRTRFGKLRPWLIFVPVPLGAATIAFFAGGEVMKNFESDMAKIIYMFVTYFIWEFFYTIGDIPYWGLSAAISPNPDDRSRVIKSARLISGIIGGIPGIILSLFMDFSDSALSKVFLIMGIIAGTFGMLLFSFSGFCTKERMVQTNNEPKLLDSFRYLFRNKPIFLLTLSSVLSTVEGIGGQFSQIYYKLSLGMASLSLLAGIPGTVAGWLTYGIMSKLEKRWSSKKIVIGVTLANTGVTVIIFLIGAKFYTNPAVIVPLLAIQGVASSITCSIKSVLPTKMIADTVDYMEWKENDRNEGTAFSILTFVGKLTGSLSASMAALIFPLIGLEKVGEDMVLVPGGEVNTQFWLWGLVTCIPSILGLIALVPYLFYDLEGEKLERIQNDLAERHALQEKYATEKAREV